MVRATGVPVGGFLPLVGIGLSDEYSEELLDLTPKYHTSQPTNSIMLGNGTPNFDVALLDTGAGFSALTSQAYAGFNIDGPFPGNSDGFDGTQSIDFEGATGTLSADVNEPLGLYALGLQGRTGSAPLAMNLSLLKGQTNTAMVTLPASSDLPNILGLPFASRYTTYIRNDMPQIFQLNGHTVRTPAVDFLAKNTGGSLGIDRRAFMQNNPSGSLSGQPLYIFNQANLDIDEPWKDPDAPTLLATGTGGSFLNVSGTENSSFSNAQFLFDTGADVTVVSSFTANQLGYSGVPDFTVAVVGSGGTAFDVPGFFLNNLTIPAETSTHGPANITLQNVPVVILDVKNPGDPDNIVPGIVGMNVFVGRNIAYDPLNGAGASLYISDPVTSDLNWSSTAASETFGAGSNWSGGTAPTTLGIANVRHVAGGNQTAVVGANATVWELNVSGTANQTMSFQVQSGVTLTTFSGINIEAGGEVNLQNGTLDAQFVEMFAGKLTGVGTIATGSGPIPGQVENRGGTVSPGNDGAGQLTVLGRFANGPAGSLNIEVGGIANNQFDKVVVTGGATLDGTLAVSLINGFNPAAGNTFTFLATTEEVGGVFKNFVAPDGMNMRVNYLASSVQLQVGNPGDFNFDNKVDASDYVVWRNNGWGPLNYAAWRSNFGTVYSGSGAAVPEPAAAALVLLSVCGFTCRRRSRVTRPVLSAA
jgi:hypothetical protein